MHVAIAHSTAAALLKTKHRTPRREGASRPLAGDTHGHRPLACFSRCDEARTPHAPRFIVTKILRTLTPLLPFALLFCAWLYVTGAALYPPELLVPPGEVWQALRDLLDTGELQAHLAISLQRLALGTGIGCMAGLLFGVAMAAAPRFEAYTRPSFDLLRQVPSIALIPMLILVFGIGETFKLLIIVKASFMTLAIATSESVKSVSSQYVDVARVYRLPRPVYLRRVLLPAIAPDLLTALRLALGRSWGVLVAAELLASESGLGQMMELGRQMFRMDIVMVGLVLTGLIGFALDRVTRRLERRLMHWRTA